MPDLWTACELPGLRWDPEPPDDGDDGPWCRLPDGNGRPVTTVPVKGDLL